MDPSGHQTRVYDEGPGDHGILVASTSAYTAPIKAMSAAQRGDVLSGASETATLRKAMRKATPAPQAPHCDNIVCGFNNAIGTAGDEARAAAPGLAVVGGAAASCAVGLLTALASAVLCAPAAGVLAYTGVNGVMNLASRKWIGEGWNAADAAASGGAGLVIASLPASTGPGTLLGIGFVTGVGLDVIDQEVQNPGKPLNWNHAVCAGGGGAVGAIPVFGQQLKALAYNVVQGVAGTTACAGH